MIVLARPDQGGRPMETFTKLFGSLLVFVYHCFDRIVINGYLSGLSRPEQVVHFFRQVIGVPRSLFHFQEHGTRAHLPDQRAEVSDQGPQPPDPGASTQPLHALLLLHLRSSAWTHSHARSVILALPGHLLSKRPLLYRTGTQESPGRLPQER